MSKAVGRLFLVVLFILSAMRFKAWAQLPEGWEFDLEPMWMGVSGFDEHMGDIVRETVVATLPPPSISDTVVRDPILLHMESRGKFRGEFDYRRHGWGGGVSGWFFSTHDARSGQVTSPVPILGSASNTFFSNTVSMWQETLSPVENDLDPSGFSPMDFHAQAGLSNFTVDLFALRTLSESPASRIELIFGTKLGRVETNEAQGFTQRAFVFDFFGKNVNYNDFINLNSNATEEYMGAGPVVGFQGQTSWKRLGIQASATQAVLIGQAHQRGNFTDIDDISVAQTPTGPFLPCPTSLANSGCFSVRSDIKFSNSERMFLPVTELHLKLELRLAKHLAIGANGFTSLWGNSPVAPAFTITHAFAAGSASPGLDWKLQERTLRFAGVGADLVIRF